MRMRFRSLIYNSSRHVIHEHKFCRLGNVVSSKNQMRVVLICLIDESDFSFSIRKDVSSFRRLVNNETMQKIHSFVRITVRPLQLNYSEIKFPN